MKRLDSSKYYYGFKKKEDAVFPPMVFAEITNVCNLECIHCPHSYVSKQEFYKPRNMEFGIFKKVIDEIADYKGAILRLVCDGEPMMHPDFLKMIIYARQKGVSPICFNTNGTLLDEERSLEILRNNVDVVEVSLDAINKSTYMKVRRGADFEKVISNVHRFIQLRRQLKARTKIMVSIIDQPEVNGEIQDFINYWTPNVDRVIKRAYTSIGGLVDKKKIDKISEAKRWPCPLLWTRTFINVDGFIKFCVEDWLNKTIIGDIRHNSIKDLWDSSVYKELRNNHLEKEFCKVNYCKDCVDWPAREWNYDYFHALSQILETSI